MSTPFRSCDVADPLRKERRAVLAAGCLGMLVAATCGWLLPAMLGSVAEEFNRNLAQRGLLLLYAPLGFTLSSLGSGHLSDRWGQRIFILIGYGLLALGMFLCCWAPAYPILCVGAFSFGAGGGLLEAPLSALCSDAYPDRRAQVLNITQIFYNIGAVAGPALVGLFLTWAWGWRTAFGFCIGVVLLSLAFSYRALPRKGKATVGSDTPQGKAAVHWWIVFWGALALSLYVGAECTIAQWSANYLEASFGAAASRAAFVVSGFWLGMMFGRALYVFVVGRWGYLIPLLLSAALSVLLALAAASASSAVWAAVWCALSGFTLGGSWPTILGYVSHKNPGRTGTVFGVVVATAGVGGVVVPPLAGWVAQKTSYHLRAAMVLGAVCIFLEGVIILGLWLWERKAERRNSEDVP